MTIDDLRGGTALLTDAWRQFRSELVEAGLLYATSSDGLYGRSATYEQIASGLRRAAAQRAKDIYGRDVGSFTFGPVYPLEAYEKTDYISSFPNLAGAIFSFLGGNPEHRALLADRAAGLPWDGHLAASGTMLVPAACHPTYEQFADRELDPQAATVYTVENWCFRREPSVDPMRMQSFRMLEYVALGTPEQARRHRETWVAAAVELLAGLGLDVEAVPANDPFFGRAGRMLAVNQRDEDLKTEIVTPVYGDLGEPTAIASGNYHLDHFGGPYHITAAGEVAHSACFGFGIDRIVLALLRTHGLNVAGWPAAARQLLGAPGA